MERYDADMAKKVIIDVDPGIDDAIALAIALFDPGLDVLAVTATGGNVSPEQATDKPSGTCHLSRPAADPTNWHRYRKRKHARAGPEYAWARWTRWPQPACRPATRHARRGKSHLGDNQGTSSRSHVSLVSGRQQIFLVCFVVTPVIVELLGDTILCGGTLHAHGGASPVADFNFYCDPFAARHVVCEPFRKSLVPLETTSQVAFGLEMLEQLPDAFTSCRKSFPSHVKPCIPSTSTTSWGVKAFTCMMWLLLSQ